MESVGELTKKFGYYEITKKKIVEGIHLGYKKAIELTEKSLIIKPVHGIDLVTLGLYSFAVEEFGKAQWLEECLLINQDPCKVPKILFTGKVSHDLKFDKAIEKLPKECGSFLAPYSKEFVTGDDGKPREPKEGENTDILFCGSAYSPIRFATRMQCFYLDWNDYAKEWEHGPIIEKFDMSSSMKAFLKFVRQLQKS